MSLEQTLMILVHHYHGDVSVDLPVYDWNEASDEEWWNLFVDLLKIQLNRKKTRESDSASKIADTTSSSRVSADKSYCAETAKPSRSRL